MSDSYTVVTNQNTQVAQFIKDTLVNKRNPASVVRAAFAHLRDLTDGKVNIVDPTNPFTFLIEASAAHTVAAIIDNESNTRRQYPSLAQTEDDLYLHMSDKDYIDRFASPANTVFTIAIRKDELIEALVPVGATGIKKLTIPRNTFFTVNETSFSMQYPVDIKQLSHGGLEITYDTSVSSPLQVLTTNNVNWTLKKLVTTLEEWVFIEVDVQQFDISSYNTAISYTSGLVKNYSFKDKFCYARVYQKNTATANKWVEIKTTHSDQVYDLAEPTVSLKVYEGKLQMTVPQVYITTNKIRGDLRIDIYQTKGSINMNLSNYTENAFQVSWLAIDSSELTSYVAPITRLTSLFTYSRLQVSGGKEAIAFDQLRSRVIRNSTGIKQVPITNVQIETSLENEGYEVVKNIDVVTNRAFLATKQLPTPFDERLITAAASSIETIVVSMADAINHPYVKDNGTRITLTPEILYKNDNGLIKMVPVDDHNAILISDPDVQAETVTNGGYLFTPFHYVLDNSTDEFEVRPYYLNNPQSTFVTFVNQNDATMLQVNTKNHRVTKTDTGYIIRLVSRGNAAYKNLPDNQTHVQLSFIPIGETDRAYLTGTYVGRDSNDDKIYQFVINSTTDIDHNDHLTLNSFKMYDLEDRKLKVDLSTSFDVLYTTTSAMGSGWTPAAIDSILGSFLLPANSIGITNDRLDVIFGYSLKTLWARSRSATQSEAYQRYSADVPMYYTEIVYKKDPVTGLDFTVDPVTKLPVFTVQHRIGDPVLDPQGRPVYKHKVGDIVTDINGSPIAINPRQVSREIDIMFIEGVYYFATDTASATYRSEITNAVVQWLTKDLAKLSTQLLEQTKIYFYPKTNMGKIKVMVEDGKFVSIDASHSFKLKMYVSKTVFEDTALRESLSSTAIRVIDNQLKKTVVSVDEILANLRDSLGNDVVSVEITKLGTNSEYNTFTVVNDSDRASLRKRLVALPNNKLIVSEDVRIDFIKHESEE